VVGITPESVRRWRGGISQLSGTWKVVNIALVALAAGAAATAYLTVGRASPAQAQVSTATVARGSVLSTVSASGNVEPAQSLALNFASSGTLVAVFAKKGQHVRKGQPLAKLDDTSEAGAVRTARASLASAEANLASLQQPLTPATSRENQVAVEQAKAGITGQQTALRDALAGAAENRKTLQKTVAQARVALQQARKAAAASAVSLRNAVGEAKGAWLEAKAAASRDLTNAQAALDQAKAQLERDQAQLASDQNDLSTYSPQVDSLTAQVNSIQAQVDADKARVADDQKKEHSDKCDLTPAPQPKCANDAYRTSQDQTQLSNDQTKLSDAQSDLNTATSKRDSAQSAVTGGQSKLAADQDAITNATNNLAAAQVKDAQSVNQAYRSYVNAKASQVSGLASNRQSVQNAQNTLKNASAALNAGVINDRQSVHNARAALVTAKQSLSSTLASNAAKAEPATGGELASARAQIASAEAALENALDAERQMTLVAPGAGTVASISASAGEAPSSTSAFITLVDLDRPQVTASFSETDAAKIKPGQAATVTVDALPNKQLAAHVVSVDTTETVVSNVVTYGVTLLLDRSVAALKPGMTVSAAVIVSKRDGVLHVPNAAVSTNGGSSTVTVLDAKGVQQQRPVTVGVVGDDATEIVSGLKAGENVVVSSAAASQLTGTNGAQTGRGGGGSRGVFFGGP
jgi:RND family efflux transporter MFP subunit